MPKNQRGGGKGGGKGGVSEKHGGKGAWKGAKGGGSKNKEKTKEEEDNKKRIPFTYESLPDSFKIEFVINERYRCTEREYRRMINSIRVLCNLEGTKFNGIPNLNVYKEESAIIEVKVIHETRWVKFLISRFDLYLVAIMVPKRNFVFSDSVFDIPGFEKLGVGATSYNSQISIEVGPKIMIRAIREMNVEDADPDFIADQARCFFLHLCESARFRVIENHIADTLKISNIPFPEPDDNAIESFQFEEEYEGEEVDDNNEAGRLLLQPFQIDQNFASNLPYYFPELIRNFENLSKAWFKYSLTNKKYKVLEPPTQRKCHIGNVRSIDSVLAILCNIDSVKFLGTLDTVSKRLPPNINYDSNDHNRVTQKISELQQRKEAFLNSCEKEEET